MGKPRTRSSSWLTPWAIADPAKDLIAVTRSNDGLDVSWCEAFECGASRFQTALLTLHREASLHTQLKLYCQKINAIILWLNPSCECSSNNCYDWLYLINSAPQINHPANDRHHLGKDKMVIFAPDGRRTPGRNILHQEAWSQTSLWCTGEYQVIPG